MSWLRLSKQISGRGVNVKDTNMKYACCYIVLNEEDYIKYSLRSVYEFADQIIVIHGSTEFANLVNSNGLSIDDTKKHITEFITHEDPQGKVEYYEVGKVKGKVELRNAYLDKVRNDIDWILVVDGDEVWRSDMLSQLRTITAELKLVHVMFPWWWFWGDFAHIHITDESYIKNAKEFEKYLKFYDKDGNVARQGEYHERCFRAGLGFRHINSHSVVSDQQGRDIYIDAFYQSQRIITNSIKFHHYGYIKPKKKLFEKFEYYHKRDKAIDPTKHEYWDYLNGNSVDNKTKSIIAFSSTHPDVMLRHPYFGKNVNQL